MTIRLNQKTWLTNLIGLSVVSILGAGCILGPIPEGPTQPPISEPSLEPTALELSPTPDSQESVEPVPGEVLVDVIQQVSNPAAPGIEIALEGQMGWTLRIEGLLQGGILDYRIILIDIFNNEIASITGNPEKPDALLGEVTLPFEGTYRLRLEAIEGGGDVRLLVTTVDQPGGGGNLLDSGATLIGRMPDTPAYHTYTFPLEAGEVVTISANGAANGFPDTAMSVYGPDGRLVASADDVDLPLNLNAVVRGFVAPLTGSYVAMVTNVDATEGDYQFRVDPDTVPIQPDSSPDVGYFEDLRARFSDQSILEVSFDGTIGDVVQIVVFDPTEELEIDLFLFSPFGQIIGYALSDGPGQRVAVQEVQLPYSGRYTLEMRPAGSGEASFVINQLDLSDLTGGGSFGNAGAGTLPGRFEAPFVFHTCQFNAFAGELITLSVSSTSFEDDLPVDIGFALIAPNGEQLIFADDSQNDQALDPELIDYEVRQTGTYTVIIYAFNGASAVYDLEYSKR